MPNERTSLFAEHRPGPSYVFPSRIHLRSRQRQVRRLQCCICSTFLAIILIGLILTISFTISTNINNNNNNNKANISQENTTNFLWLNTKDNNLSETEHKVLNVTDIINLLTLTQWPLNDEPVINWTLPEPTIMEKEIAINYGLKKLGDREIFEENMISIPLNTPSYRHQRAVSTTADARKLTKRGYVENYATINMATRNSFQKQPGRSNIGTGPEINFKFPLHSNKSKILCNFNSKYRYINGTCNNKHNPFTYGVALAPFRRALHPDYSDGITAPRGSHSNTSLPSAREVSIRIHRPSYSSDPKFTVMLAVWGQFLDHDITATALNQGAEGEPIDCCTTVSNELHPECFPVPISPGDPYYDIYNISCMNFVRSAPAPTLHFGPREQLNQATAYIDGSVIYGATEQRVHLLRTNKNGLLKMYNTPDNRTLLPVSTDPTDGCNEAEQNEEGKYCFESGDTRANENLHLTSMHLIWARHHNYLAINLQQLNPNWTDEIVFQESKKIVSAQLQHITYNELLPIILGHEFCEKVGILSKPNDDNDTYKPYVNPSIANVFAASAFRFAHTLLPGIINSKNEETIALHTMLFNPYSLWGEKGLDIAIESAMGTSLARSDPYFTTELTEKLFQNINHSTTMEHSKKTCGLDLVSLNIQRGRDHGLPAYTEWRKFCNLPPTDTWTQMKNAVNLESLKNIMEIYSEAIDVDVYTGALSEPPLPGAIVGPLLMCLLTDQFLRIKTGDSHWYERKIGAQKFTKDQLNEIYNTTLSAIICRNSDAVKYAQKYVMQRVNKDNNDLVDCNLLNIFDFTPWDQDNIDNANKKYSIRIDTQKSNIKNFLTPNNSTNKNITKL